MAITPLKTNKKTFFHICHDIYGELTVDLALTDNPEVIKHNWQLKLCNCVFLCSHQHEAARELNKEIIYTFKIFKIIKPDPAILCFVFNSDGKADKFLKCN